MNVRVAYSNESLLSNPNQNTSLRHACDKIATSLRKLAAI